MVFTSGCCVRYKQQPNKEGRNININTRGGARGRTRSALRLLLLLLLEGLRPLLDGETLVGEHELEVPSVLDVHLERVVKVLYVRTHSFTRTPSRHGRDTSCC